MSDITTLIQKLDESGQDVFWHGSTSLEAIGKLEKLIGTKLPKSFRDFLSTHGGGGISEEEISGIEDSDPTLEHRGTVYGDTLICREDYGLLENLIVVYLGMDDVVWCLDTDQFENNECPVVSFDVFSKKTKHLANSFESFLIEYLNLRLNR